MTYIHPTAIVDPHAQIDHDVHIGPYTIIGATVRIGARTTIGAHSILEGVTTIGVDNRIGHYAVIGGAPQDMKYQGEPTELLIGDRNTIREFTTIHTGTVQDKGVTRIGSDNWIMSYVHIGHDCLVGNHTIFSSNAQIAGHVTVGDWAILGGMCGVHQFIQIGTHAMLGGASALVQDLPPFVIAAGDKAVPHGINVEGLKRRGFSPSQISHLRQAYKILYKSELSLESAISQIHTLKMQSEAENTEPLETLIAFLQGTSRGIIR